MLESSLPAGMRGTFVPDDGAPLRAVVIVSHADGRVVLETLGSGPLYALVLDEKAILLLSHALHTQPAASVKELAVHVARTLQQAKTAPRPPLPPALVQE